MFPVYWACQLETGFARPLWFFYFCFLLLFFYVHVACWETRDKVMLIENLKVFLTRRNWQANYWPSLQIYSQTSKSSKLACFYVHFMSKVRTLSHDQCAGEAGDQSDMGSELHAFFLADKMWLNFFSQYIWSFNNTYY